MIKAAQLTSIIQQIHIWIRIQTDSIHEIWIRQKRILVGSVTSLPLTVYATWAIHIYCQKHFQI